MTLERAQGEVVRSIPFSINGEWSEGTGEPVVLKSPATGEELAWVGQGTRTDVDRAVKAAREAAERLSRMTAFEAAALCHRIADLLGERKDEIARDISREQGKPFVGEAVPEVEIAVEMFRDAGECAKRLHTEWMQSSDPAKRVFTIRQPRGVYGILTPWNYPIAIPSEYLAPALATGNAMVWKPSEWTPLSAWHLMRCFLDAGVPEGTLNLVQGPPAEIGDAIVGHPGVAAIGLTGSSRTGELVAQRGAGKAMLLELGGNGPTIVFGDADLATAVARTAAGCFENAGQICDSTERILVEAPVHDDFVAGLVEEARRVRLGSPFDRSTSMGPLTNEPTAAKMDTHLEDAQAQGAIAVFGGARADGFATRLYYLPTVVDGVRPSMRISMEETFGPVAPILTFRDEAEALAMANTIPLGLAGAVFSRDVARAMRIAERMEVGVVNINDTSAYWQPHTPFGGYSGKRSGLGRIGGLSTLLEMTQIKTITMPR